MRKASQPGEAAADDVGKLLRAWSDGDQSALEGLTPSFMTSSTVWLTAT